MAEENEKRGRITLNQATIGVGALIAATGAVAMNSAGSQIDVAAEKQNLIDNLAHVQHSSAMDVALTDESTKAASERIAAETKLGFGAIAAILGVAAASTATDRAIRKNEPVIGSGKDTGRS